MKIAFATIFDTVDIRRGSGTFYHMSQEMELQKHTVYYTGPIQFQLPLISRSLGYLHRKLGKRYVMFLDPFVGRKTGRQMEQKLAGLDYDVLITNDLAIAGFTDVDRPVVLYTDAMLTRDYEEATLPHSRLSNLSLISLWLCRKTIRRALQRTDLACFPAQWAADEALKYHYAPEKIKVIPFGANILDPGPGPSQNRSLSHCREMKPIEFLFVGKEWQRKGGDVAVETVRHLNQRNIPARLHVVGTNPPIGVDTSHMTLHGYLDKGIEKERQTLMDLYCDCDVFILPSSSEGFVIGVLEAAAYGLPVLGYDAMGVTTAVLPDKSGVLLPLNAPAIDFAHVVEGWLKQPRQYERLVTGAREHYEKSANWQKSVSTLMEVIEQQCF